MEIPEEIVKYRPRDGGGLGMTHVKYKATAELIRSFLETALISKFMQNSYHSALFQWNVLQNYDIPEPGLSPYITNDILVC